MKKLIPGILALMMCFGTLAGCDQIDKIKDKIPFLPNNDSSTPAPDDSSTPGGSDSTPEAPTQAHAADLANVRALVFADMLEASNTANRSYTVPNSYSHDGKVYDVSWTVTDADGNAVTGVSVQEGDSNDTIIIDVTGADVNYVLTGTITCPEGCCSISHKFNRVAQEVPVPVAITEAPQEGVAYKFYVWQPAKNGGTDCYPTGRMANTHFLETTPDYSKSIDLYVKNVDGGFYLYHVVDGENVYIHVIKSGTFTNAKYWTLDEIKEKEGANATPSVWKLDEEWGTIATTLSDGKYYLGCDGTYDTIEPQYKTEDGYYMGYLCTMKSKSEVVITDEKKVQDTLGALSFAEKYTLDVSNQILPTTGTKYAEVAITWAVDGEGAVLESNFLSFIIPTEATTVTVTATASCGDYSHSRPFTIQLGPKSVEVEDKTDVAAIWAAANNLAHGEKLPGFYTFTGTITSIDTPWDSGYSNITVSFKVNDDITMKCYRLKSGEADASGLKVGDVITVNGQLTNHYDKIQFAQGCTLQAVAAGEGGESGDEGEVTPPVSDGLEEGIGYHLSARNVNGPIYFIGTITDGRFNASASIDESVPVYVENVDGGQLIYFFMDNVKTYVIFGDSTTGASTTTSDSEATVFEWNASLNTMVVADDNNNRAFATNSSKDYVNFSAYDVSGSYYWAQYTVIEDDDSSSDDTTSDDSTSDSTSGDDSSSDVTPDDSTSDSTSGDDSSSDVTPDDSTSGDSSSTGGETGGDDSTGEGEGDDDTTTDAPVNYTEMTITEAIAATDGTKVQVSGTVSVAGAWNETYGNIDVTIVDADGNTLKVYRLTTKVALGDIITVKGEMATYNEARQIAAGATAEITGHDESFDYVEMTIAQALEAADDTNVIVTGTVTNIGTAYNSQYNNISVTITDDNGDSLYLYRLSGDVALKAIITVKGSMATYNGARQVAAGATFEQIGTHTCSVYSDATCKKPAKCIVCGTAKDDILADHSYVDGICSVCGYTEGAVAAQYVKVTAASDFTTGTYVLIVGTKNITLSTYDGSWIRGSELDAGDAIDKNIGDDLAITLEVTDSGVKIKIGNDYMAPKGGNNNGIKSSDYTWAYEFQEDGTIIFKGVNSDTVYLAYNVSSTGFRGYKTATVDGNQTGYPYTFTAYKLAD